MPKQLHDQRGARAGVAIAVSTTTARTLEAVGRRARQTDRRGSGTTALFITGLQFRIIRGS